MAFIQSILLAAKHNNKTHIIDAAFKYKTIDINEQQIIKYDIIHNIYNLLDNLVQEPHGSILIDKSYYIYYIKDGLGCFAVITDNISIDELKYMYKSLETLYNQYVKDMGEIWKKITRDFCTHYKPVHELINTPIKPIDILEKTVEETKEVIKQTIVTLLNRGEKLVDLQNKSEELVINSKMFYKKTRRISRTHYIIIGILSTLILYCLYVINLIIQRQY
jgi:hypothetical protein